METIMNFFNKLAGKKSEPASTCDPEELAQSMLMKNEDMINNWYNTK
jgi:hypothetical protein